jgi:hypothetical protein
MLTMRTSVLLVLTVLMVLPAAVVIADDIDHVVILKCAEFNIPGDAPFVFQGQASKGFVFPASCQLDFDCAQCLRDLIHKKDCEADDKFPGTPAVVQFSVPNQDTLSIEKYVFVCGEDDDDD